MENEKVTHPKTKTHAELMEKIREALTEDCGGMIGDLTVSDAAKVEGILNILGFKTRVETETVGGRFVDSDDWVLVRFSKGGAV